MSNADAAGCLGISLGALELLLVRARKSMRRELADLIEGD
jgi:DNA-directed RNA polymerase specialized sigma24 family protein